MARENHVVVIGAGVAGLMSALGLGRLGYSVTLLEQDRVAMATDAEEAFAQVRRGAPQVHQTHGFLARIQVLLREHFPDVHAQLIAAGGSTMPTTANLGDPEPDDEDLTVLIVRRTTLDWVLRQAVEAEAEVTILDGTRARSLVGEKNRRGAPAHIRGVRLGTGEILDADFVVDASGRRSPIVRWLRDLGVTIAEKVHHSGLVYLSRWYRIESSGKTLGDPKLAGDLGYLKFLAVPGDAGTLSITLAVASSDTELRRALSNEDHFDAACGMLRGPARFFEEASAEPLSLVKPMGGLVNRLRRFKNDRGEPLVTGLHAVGDSHTCTNPLYGRGCSLALVQALALRDAVVSHPDDPFARCVAYETSCEVDVEPWFDVSVEMDRAMSLPKDSAKTRGFATLFAAAGSDPVIGRAMMRFWNLLATPAQLMADTAFMARAAEVMSNPDGWPLPPEEGPTREQLIAGIETEEFVHA